MGRVKIHPQGVYTASLGRLFVEVFKLLGV